MRIALCCVRVRVGSAIRARTALWLAGHVARAVSAYQIQRCLQRSGQRSENVVAVAAFHAMHAHEGHMHINSLITQWVEVLWGW
jgi:hypothetical protein